MRRFGLIGHPVGHSFSADYFNTKFRREGIDAAYTLHDLADISELPASGVTGFDGFNVTSPYKEQVIPYLAELSEGAAGLRAVNVVKRRPDGSLEGHNTDVVGLERSLSGWLPESAGSALVLGTGGAARAVEYVLRRRGMKVTKVSRSPKVEGEISYRDLTPGLLAATPLIVNASPVGMGSLAAMQPDIPYEAVTPDHFCMDLIYNPAETRFLALCRGRGAATKNGLEMLTGQADAAWEIWNR